MNTFKQAQLQTFGVGQEHLTRYGAFYPEAKKISNKLTRKRARLLDRTIIMEELDAMVISRAEMAELHALAEEEACLDMLSSNPSMYEDDFCDCKLCRPDAPWNKELAYTAELEGLDEMLAEDDEYEDEPVSDQDWWN